jgi:hypothetical protein
MYRQNAEMLMKYHHMVNNIKLTIPSITNTFASKQTNSAQPKTTKEKNPIPSD